MALKGGIFLIIVLIISWKSAYANTALIDNNPIIEINGDGHEKLCTLCHDFTTQATTFLKENKTRSEILDILHYACSQLQSLELKCTVLVDYYSSLFFDSLDKMHPDDFCGRVGLCVKPSVSIAKDNDKCELCHQAVVEVLLKLKDPDVQMGILQLLFKECNKMKNYAHECKRLVMQYGPYVLIDGENFLEKNDVCVTIHACSSIQVEPARAIRSLGSSIQISDD